MFLLLSNVAHTGVDQDGIHNSGEYDDGNSAMDDVDVFDSRSHVENKSLENGIYDEEV